MFNVLIYYSIKYIVTKKDIDQQSLDSLPEDQKKVLQEIIDDNEIVVSNVNGVLTTKNKLMLVSVINRHLKKMKDVDFNLSAAEILAPILFKIQFPSLLEISVKFARKNIDRKIISEKLTSDSKELVNAQPEFVLKQTKLFNTKGEFNDFIKFLVRADNFDDDIEKLKDANNRNILHLLTLYKAPFSMIKNVLLKSDKLHVADSLGNTPFHYAAQSGSIETIMHFLKYKVIDVRTVNASNATALHFAAESGEFEAFKLLYDRSDMADLHLVDIHGNGLIHYAARGANIKIMKFLVNIVGLNVVNQPNNINESPLYQLLSKADELGANNYLVPKYENGAKYLINNGARLDQISDQGNTPIDFILGSTHRRLLKISYTPVLPNLQLHSKVKAEHSIYEYFSGFAARSAFVWFLYDIYSRLSGPVVNNKFPPFAFTQDEFGKIQTIPTCAIMSDPELFARLPEYEQEFLLPFKESCNINFTPSMIMYLLFVVMLVSFCIPASCIRSIPADPINDNDDDQEMDMTAAAPRPGLG